MRTRTGNNRKNPYVCHKPSEYDKQNITDFPVVFLQNECPSYSSPAVVRIRSTSPTRRGQAA